MQVSYKITIASSTYRSGQDTRLVDLRSHASLQVPINTCRLVLSPPDDVAIAPQDAVSVELGYGDDLALVFTGTVSTVTLGIERVTIQAVSAMQQVAIARFNLLYEKSKAGDMVQDVISQLNVEAGQVEAGLEFPVYVLGDNATTYHHLHHLAQQCGFDFYADVEDRIVFAPYKPAQTHEFTYGVNLLAVTADEPVSPISGVEIYGESPTSFGQGPDAYAWLTKQDVQGKAGDSSGLVLRLVDPTARTQETAGNIATAVLAAHTQKRQGTVRALGQAVVQLGDAIKIIGTPAAGTYKVTRVLHTLNVTQGFCTLIHWEDS